MSWLLFIRIIVIIVMSYCLGFSHGLTDKCPESKRASVASSFLFVYMLCCILLLTLSAFGGK